MAELQKKAREPVYYPDAGAAFPKMIYNANRTYAIVNNAKELSDKLAENKRSSSLIWAETPAAFGIETAPEGVPQESRPGAW